MEQDKLKLLSDLLKTAEETVDNKIVRALDLKYLEQKLNSTLEEFKIYPRYFKRLG